MHFFTKNSDLINLRRFQDMKFKLQDWDGIGKTYHERIKGLENENLILKDKNDILKVK